VERQSINGPPYSVPQKWQNAQHLSEDSQAAKRVRKKVEEKTPGKNIQEN